MPETPKKESVDEAFAGIFDKKASRISLTGEILTNDAGKPDGAAIGITIYKQRDDPDVREIQPGDVK